MKRRRYKADGAGCLLQTSLRYPAKFLFRSNGYDAKVGVSMGIHPGRLSLLVLFIAISILGEVASRSADGALIGISALQLILIALTLAFSVSSIDTPEQSLGAATAVALVLIVGSWYVMSGLGYI